MITWSLYMVESKQNEIALKMKNWVDLFDFICCVYVCVCIFKCNSRLLLIFSPFHIYLFFQIVAATAPWKSCLNSRKCCFSLTHRSLPLPTNKSVHIAGALMHFRTYLWCANERTNVHSQFSTIAFYCPFVEILERKNYIHKIWRIYSACFSS